MTLKDIEILAKQTTFWANALAFLRAKASGSLGQFRHFKAPPRRRG